MRPRVGVVVGLTALSLGMANSPSLVHLDGDMPSALPGFRGHRDRMERVRGTGQLVLLCP